MLARWNRVWMASVILAPLVSPAALAQVKGAWVDPPSDLSAPQALDQSLDWEVGPLDLKLDPSPNVVAGPSPSAPLSVPKLAERPGDEPGPSGKAVESKQESRSTDFTSLGPTILGPTVRSRVIPPQTAARGQAIQPTREAAPASLAQRTAQQSSPPRRGSTREEDARTLAQNYLSVWSASNHQTLRATPGFYGSKVRFHGRSMSLAALLAEKRRFVHRWPDRTYRYEPGAMDVRCDSAGESCIVRSTFDFDASNARLGRRSRGVGAHELVVSFADDRPVITSENSRVVRRGSRL
jgi:hypothetical protein